MSFKTTANKFEVLRNETSTSGPSNSTASSFLKNGMGEDASELAVKKRKVMRACDVCRKRKVRCDFVQLPSGNLQKCLNCFSSEIDCIFTEDEKPRKSPKSFVESLQKKIERSEKLLELLCPDPKLRQELLAADPDELPGTLTTSPSPSASTSYLPPEGPIIESIPNAFFKASKESPLDLAVISMRVQMFRRYPPEHDEFQEPEDGPVEPDDVAEAEHISQLTYNKMKAQQGDDILLNTFFLGKSSGRALLHQALDTKGQTYSKGKQFLGQRRPEYWKLFPWEQATFRPTHSEAELPTFDFPEPPLLKVLVDNYFKYINLELPLLHRPTFEKELSEGLHTRKPAFGATVLLVCAIGARYSEDPRVRLSEEEAIQVCGLDDGAMEGTSKTGPTPGKASSTGADGDEHWRKQQITIASHSKGWKYFQQAWNANDSHLIFSPANLYNLHYHCLATEYLRGTSLASWLTVGIGIRLVQEAGAHRRRKLKSQSHMEPLLVQHDELWKRAVWVLITLDRTLSASTGRPCALHDEDFDLELPIECDDEYWDNPDPEKRFKQPDNKPSLVTAFTLTIRLNQILAICLRSIYSINKENLLTAFFKEPWESKVVSEIDSALNKWFDTIPPHLRWDPQQPNQDFFTQSAILHSAYYHTQILLHRPFIPIPDRTTAVPFPSLEVCINAARSLIHIGLAQLNRTGGVSISMPFQATSGAIIILIKMWDSRKLGKLTEQRYKADMVYVNGCLEILNAAKKRWFLTGRLWDLVHSLATVNERYVPASPDPLSPLNKPLSDRQEAKVTKEWAADPTKYTSSPFAPSPPPASSSIQPAAEPRFSPSSATSPDVPKSKVAPSSAERSLFSPIKDSSTTSTISSGGGHSLLPPSSHTAAANSDWSVFASPPETSQPQMSVFSSNNGSLAERQHSGDGRSQDGLNFGNHNQGGGYMFMPVIGGDSMGGGNTFNPAEDFEMSSSIIPPSLWQNGSDPHLDDWGSYLTGIADLTSHYDFLFPHEPSTMHSEQPRVVHGNGT